MTERTVHAHRSPPGVNQLTGESPGSGVREPLLAVRGLVTTAGSGPQEIRLVDHLDLSINDGEFVAVVGESGCGKSMTCLSIGGLLPPGVQIATGSVRFVGQELTNLTRAQMRKVHGRYLGMVFQDPLSSLNPTMRIGKQIAEPLVVHRMARGQAALERSEELLDLVGFADPRRMAKAYPHELSGGMRQRVAIAIALACRPRMVIADEPTTALDATVQAQVLDLIKKIQRELNVGILFVSHDLRTVARVADRVLVMYAGRAVEMGTTSEVMRHPKHRYTQALLKATPGAGADRMGRLQQIQGSVPEPRAMPTGCRFHTRCAFADQQCVEAQPAASSEGTRQWWCWHPADASDVRATEASVSQGSRQPDELRSPGTVPLLDAKDVRKVFKVGVGGVLGRGASELVAVDAVSLRIDRTETLGLVGESGSGKSTLGRILVALEPFDGGSVCFEGSPLAGIGREQLRQLRKGFQMMFQDSYSSLDRHMRVEQILTEPLEIHRVGTARERSIAAAKMLDRVGLPASFAHRFPRELSGGQRQRVGLGRALMLGPKLIVADEPVSSLDVSVQAKVLNLMQDLQEAEGLSYLFISHDLAVVRYMASRIAVMYRGRIVESGPTEGIYRSPLHPYTRALLEAVDPMSARDANGEAVTEASTAGSSPGCPYRARCPYAADRCGEESPLLVQHGPYHAVACHYPLGPPLPIGVPAAEVSERIHGQGSHG